MHSAEIGDKATINEWKIPWFIFHEYAEIKKKLISIQNSE
jgi:hypothetical protein